MELDNFAWYWIVIILMLPVGYFVDKMLGFFDDTEVKDGND